MTRAHAHTAMQRQSKHVPGGWSARPMTTGRGEDSVISTFGVGKMFPRSSTLSTSSNVKELTGPTQGEAPFPPR